MQYDGNWVIYKYSYFLTYLQILIMDISLEMEFDIYTLYHDHMASVLEVGIAPSIVYRLIGSQCLAESAAADQRLWSFTLQFLLQSCHAKK